MDAKLPNSVLTDIFIRRFTIGILSQHADTFILFPGLFIGGGNDSDLVEKSSKRDTFDCKLQLVKRTRSKFFWLF